MSDRHTDPQKILFWTDKRPIAPDVETRITCAIAEASLIAGYAAAFLLQFGTMFLLVGVGSTTNWDEPISAYTHIAMIAFLGAAAVVSRHQIPKSNGQPLAFRSGIPETRTGVSHFLMIVTSIVFAVWFGGLLANLVGYLQFFDFSENTLSVFGVLFVLSILQDGRRVQELLLWVLDLRAEQGHVIAFEPHPMAAPMTVENDWWKKPKSPAP
jgi:hypothetical protein